jgi:hypothetical protein
MLFKAEEFPVIMRPSQIYIGKRHQTGSLDNDDNDENSVS